MATYVDEHIDEFEEMAIMTQEVNELLGAGMITLAESISVCTNLLMER